MFLQFSLVFVKLTFNYNFNNVHVINVISVLFQLQSDKKLFIIFKTI